MSEFGQPVTAEADVREGAIERRERSKETISAAKQFIAEYPDFDIDMVPAVADPDREKAYATFAGDLSLARKDESGAETRKKIYLVWEVGVETFGPFKVTTDPSRYTDEIRDLS